MTSKREDILSLIEELIAGQQKKLLEVAHRHRPHLTTDDILQPNDFPELEYDPLFRYEEGVLEGLLTVRMAVLANK